MTIPKVIYQTWKSKNLPIQIQKHIDEMLSYNLDYEYIFYDDNDIKEFIKDNYDKKINLAYDMLKIGAAKADLWRYLILYKNGGIYIDVDSKIKKPLNDLINENDKAIITRELGENKLL